MPPQTLSSFLSPYYGFALDTKIDAATDTNIHRIHTKNYGSLLSCRLPLEPRDETSGVHPEIVERNIVERNLQRN